MKLFLLIFVLSLLFIVGSAMAMKYFDNAVPKSGDTADSKALKTENKDEH